MTELFCFRPYRGAAGPVVRARMSVARGSPDSSRAGVLIPSPLYRPSYWSPSGKLRRTYRKHVPSYLLLHVQYLGRQLSLTGTGAVATAAAFCRWIQPLPPDQPGGKGQLRYSIPADARWCSSNFAAVLSVAQAKQADALPRRRAVWVQSGCSRAGRQGGSCEGFPRFEPYQGSARRSCEQEPYTVG